MLRFGYFRKWVLAASFAALFVQTTARAGEARATYTVKAGESLSVIAEQRGVSLALLRKVNGLPADTIRPGQLLLLPTLHVVKAGDVLGTIASRYGAPLSALYRHNDLHEGSVLKVGQRVLVAGGTRGSTTTRRQSHATEAKGSAARNRRPAKQAAKRKPKTPKVEYYLHKVRRKEVLSVIARRYAVSIKRLSELNHLGRASLIRIGQRLKIPISDKNAHLTRPKPWSKYARRKFTRGKVTLKTMGGQWTGRVLDKKGKVLPQAKKRVQSLLASWESGRQRKIALHPGLYKLIVRVSDEFGGRPIRVVSGYRERSFARHSKHRVGRALDFSIPGVPNSAVVDFLLTLPNTGVGYYPNTTHVHMDARHTRMYWVDISGPGQAPRYVHKSTTGERARKVSSTSTKQHHRHVANRPRTST